MSEEKFEFHFHAPVGQNIAKVENMTVHMDKDGKIQVMNADNITAPTEQPAPTTEPQQPFAKPEIELFRFIHYDITDENERLRVHMAVCNIVKLPKMSMVIEALKDLMDNKRILRTVKQDSMLAELRRLGLPDGTTPGFSDNNFFSAYKNISGF